LGAGWLEAAIEGHAAAPADTYPAVWDRWNDSTPEEQVAGCLEWDARLVERYEALSDTELAAARVQLFGQMDLDGRGLVRLRLKEHAVHTWDIAVAFDPNAVVAADAVAVVVDEVAGVAGYFGHPTGETRRVRIRTTDPERALVMEVGEGVALRPAGSGSGADWSGPADLTLPAEVLVRLVYGRARTGDGVPEHVARVFAPQSV
ncbi:MAG TPA: maleylpyruvate isomerase N-terminal domain-containing protein, partial [Acidimicrobiales bacterium]|nr:maleylpyruvate isomerase N-terminal domain-containing protein [Acidimicrobiales bacterium]